MKYNHAFLNCNDFLSTLYKAMDFILQWNMYYGPILLILGIVLQAIFLYKTHLSFVFPGIGALCISCVAYMDSDLILFVGQMAVLFLQFCLRKKNV